MTDETGGDQPQKTVAELLAQHGAQVDGGRRRRRRAVDDEDEAPAAPPAPEPGHSRRKPEMGDTAPQAIIDRVTADGGTPPPANRNGGRRARPQAAAPQPPVQPGPSQALPPQALAPPALPPQGPQPQDIVPPAPRPVPQESGPLQRPSRQAPQESGQYARPPLPQESGQYPRPPHQESGQYARPQESGQFVRPPQPQESEQLPLPPRGRGPRRQPPPPDGQETRGQLPVARRRPAGPPPVAPVPSPGALSARLDGLDGTPDDGVLEPPAAPGQMPSGSFAAPPAQPRPPRRPPARRSAPKVEPHTEQFAAVPDEVEPEPPAPEPPALDEPPAGLASWRKRRQKTQLDDTEVGVMPPVPPSEPELEPEAFDAGPPTMGHPAPMPFAPARQAPAELPPAHPDDLDEYEREFDDPRYAPSYADDRYVEQDDEYDYDAADGYEDEADLDVADEDEPFAEEQSPGKQWLALAGQLALGVVGGAAVWLGFNWLWVNIPAAALVAALLVVVGLVWIVRKIRRAEDLQTTVLAVLVGLVVTVSPAALLLVSR
ncbi:hypothetical protein [Amycolatopsis sp. H20-H5]|uniref:hypothetical protein n=1 Tax=Amycolatopsis sp. H20-H5 TaxID=3046309 RepID=UPI002DB95D6A|nr:hypothetical protein [Amycolatopsis sp. H20-H5]MEC3975354.1 hypothetical protein [Amycolatopsis sp. H20-H5]